jgi:hypothetical protein
MVASNSLSFSSKSKSFNSKISVALLLFSTSTSYVEKHLVPNALPSLDLS